jgi:uncharacterized protein YndB with AHSA1/START domain
MIPTAIAVPPGITLRLCRRFSRTPEVVFRAWTNPDNLRRWWSPPGWTPAEMEVDLRVGGSYRLGMRTIEGGETVYVHGRFLEVCVPRKLIYSWKWENAFEQMPETQVTVSFIESEGGTELELIQEPLPEISICLRVRAGWLDAWQRLKKVL